MCVCESARRIGSHTNINCYLKKLPLQCQSKAIASTITTYFNLYHPHSNWQVTYYIRNSMSSSSRIQCEVCHGFSFTSAIKHGDGQWYLSNSPNGGGLNFLGA